MPVDPVVRQADLGKVFEAGDDDLEHLLRRCNAHHPGRDLIRGEEREVEGRLLCEQAITHVFRHLAAVHLDLPVQQAAWHADVRPGFCRAAATARRDGRTADRKPRRQPDPSDDRLSGDCPQLFCQERIVRDVRLRLLREPIGGVELIVADKPDDLRERHIPRPPDSRGAMCPPRDSSGCYGESDDRGDNPRPARHPRPRDSGRRSGRQSRLTCSSDVAQLSGRDCAPLSVAHEHPVHDVF